MYYKNYKAIGGTPRRATTTSRRRTTTPSRRRTTLSRRRATMSRRRATMSRTTGRRVTTTPNMLKTSLHFLFTYIAEIHKWDDNIDDVVDAYITMFKKSNVFKTGSSPSPSPSPSPSQSGGKFDFPFKKYATWLMHTAVGKFDSPCNILISSIALSTYAIMVYAFVQSMQKHNFDVAAATSDESYIYSLATPVKYALYHYFPSVHEFQEQIFVIFDEYIRQVFHSFSEQFSISVVSQNPTKMIINLLRGIYYDGNLYNLFVVKPVSCILQYKIKSCKRLC
jgi:hypothetical protein